MISNDNLIVAIYNEDGSPATSLSPTWDFIINLDTGTSPTDPTVVEIVVSGVHTGVYRITKINTGHVVGRLNFGPGKYPQYIVYECTPENEVTFTSNGESIAPVIISVSTPRRTQVRIQYSIPVFMDTTPVGALNISNYSIPSLTLYSISEIDAQTVLLTTSAQDSDAPYSLSVVNVESTTGIPIG